MKEIVFSTPIELAGAIRQGQVSADDAALAHGESWGPLNGMPMAHKHALAGRKHYHSSQRGTGVRCVIEF